MIKNGLRFRGFLRKICKSKFSKCPYNILGIERTAERSEIKAAFKKLVKKHHPDISGPENAEKFKNILKAYEIIKDPMKRKMHDIDQDAKRRGTDESEDIFNNSEFYNNRWYNYTRPKEDIRAEYSINEEKKWFI